MTPFPEVTLIIPTHNRAKLLLATVESALAQTQPFAKIIVIDDASPDDTLALLKRYEGKISVVEATKIGVQRARNLGVALATTDYVTFCDDDDLLYPDLVEQVSTCISAHPDLDSLYMNYRSFYETKTDPDIVARAPEGFFAGAVVADGFFLDIPNLCVKTIEFQPLMPSGATFKKEFYDRIGGFDASFNRVPSEDWEFTLRALMSGRTGMSVQPLVKIRRHSGNDSADLMRQAVGEVEVIRYALLHHKEVEQSWRF